MSTTEKLASNLARNLVQIREARGITQQQLAKVSGIPRATIANLESGGANPTVLVLSRVSAALQVSLDELIGAPKQEGRLYRAA